MTPRGRLAAPVVALARPRREEEQDLGTSVARDDVPLVGLELHKCPGAGLERLAARLDANAAVGNDDESVLLHLMVTELLARVEADQDGTGLL